MVLRYQNNWEKFFELKIITVVPDATMIHGSGFRVKVHGENPNDNLNDN